MAEELVKDLVTGFTEALQGIRITPTGRTTATLDRFSGQGGMLLEDWLEEVDLYCEQSQISETQKVSVIKAHLEGPARKELRCYSETLDTNQIVTILQNHFGKTQTVQSLQQAFYDRNHINPHLLKYN